MQRSHSGFGRIARVVAIAASCIAFVLAVPAVAYACPICFQVEDTNTIAGVRAGVIVLMSVTVVVLGAVGAFSIRLWRNEKSGERHE